MARPVKDMSHGCLVLKLSEMESRTDEWQQEKREAEPEKPEKGRINPINHLGSDFVTSRAKTKPRPTREDPELVLSAEFCAADLAGSAASY